MHVLWHNLFLQQSMASFFFHTGKLSGGVSPLLLGGQALWTLISEGYELKSSWFIKMQDHLKNIFATADLIKGEFANSFYVYLSGRSS